MPGHGTRGSVPVTGAVRVVSADDAQSLREHGGDPVGQVVEREVGRRHRQVAVQQGGIGSVQPCPEPVGLGQGEPVEAEGGELGRHRVGADGQRAPVDDRLDGRVAETLPGGRQDDHVAGPIGVVDRGAGRLLAGGPGRPGTAPRPPGRRARVRSRPRPAPAASRRRRARRPRRCRRPRSCGGWPGWAGAPAAARPRCRARRAATDGRSSVRAGRRRSSRSSRSDWARRRRCTRWWRRCRGRPAGAGSAR